MSLRARCFFFPTHRLEPLNLKVGPKPQTQNPFLKFFTKAQDFIQIDSTWQSLDGGTVKMDAHPLSRLELENPRLIRFCRNPARLKRFIV